MGLIKALFIISCTGFPAETSNINELHKIKTNKKEKYFFNTSIDSFKLVKQIKIIGNENKKINNI